MAVVAHGQDGRRRLVRRDPRGAAGGVANHHRRLARWPGRSWRRCRATPTPIELGPAWTC